MKLAGILPPRDRLPSGHACNAEHAHEGSHGSTRQGRQPPGSTASQVQPAGGDPTSAGPTEHIAGCIGAGGDLDQRRSSGGGEPSCGREPRQRAGVSAWVASQSPSDRRRLVTPLRAGDRGVPLRPAGPAQHRHPDGGNGCHPGCSRTRLLGIGDRQDRLILTSGAHRGERDAAARVAHRSASPAPRPTARSRPCRPVRPAGTAARHRLLRNRADRGSPSHIRIRA